MQKQWQLTANTLELAANIEYTTSLEAYTKTAAKLLVYIITEFLYMDSSDFPTEGTNTKRIKQFLKEWKGKPVVVHYTMDIEVRDKGTIPNITTRNESHS